MQLAGAIHFYPAVEQSLYNSQGMQSLLGPAHTKISTQDEACNRSACLCGAVGGNLQDVMREEEARAAAARAAQPTVTDVKTAAPGAARAGGWARVAARPTASKGTCTPSFCPSHLSCSSHAGQELNKLD